MNTPSKYQDVATLVRKTTHAKAVVLCIVEGSKGSGGAIEVEQGYAPNNAELAAKLRQIADTLEKTC